MRFSKKLFFTGLASLMLAGCGAGGGVKNSTQQGQSSGGTEAAQANAADNSTYTLAIKDAAVIEADEIITLPMLDGDVVNMVTWSKYPYSYHEGKETQLTFGELWVTLDGDVRKICQDFNKATLNQELQMLLGLPLKRDEQRKFVTMEVKARNMFRPCADPSLKAGKCTAEFPAGVNIGHQIWYARQSANSYHSPNGFPWTRLGYTYNWKEGADEVGVAEFVVRKGATVKTVSIIDSETYCSELPPEPVVEEVAAEEPAPVEEAAPAEEVAPAEEAVTEEAAAGDAPAE